MIAVIADDFTGAAELGGIGLRHRMAVEVVTSAEAVTGNDLAGIDLLVIAADTRSQDCESAVKEMERLTKQLIPLHPEWIYKKTDSVLRGHVLPELRAQLDVLKYERALLIPANPSLGRTITDGRYFLNGLPVHQSAFSIDPEFPIRSNDIQDMLHTRDNPVYIRKVTDELPDSGIVVGEVADSDDLHDWSSHIQPDTLLAGASGFFSTLLDEWKINGKNDPVPSLPGQPVLFVSGSTFDSSRKAIRAAYKAGGPVAYMPDEPDYRWRDGVDLFLREQGKAIIAIEEIPGDQGRSAHRLRATMAAAIGILLRQVKVGELIIEGGSTAYAILQQAGLRTFFPEQELAPGVIRMRVREAPSLYVTVKPGSYHWAGSFI